MMTSYIGIGRTLNIVEIGVNSLPVENMFIRFPFSFVSNGPYRTASQVYLIALRYLNSRTTVGLTRSNPTPANRG